MTGREAAARVLYGVGPEFGPTTGWRVTTIVNTEAARGGMVLTVRDPSGQLSVTGHLADLDDWAVDLAAKLTMIQVQQAAAAVAAQPHRWGPGPDTKRPAPTEGGYTEGEGGPTSE